MAKNPFGKSRKVGNPYAIFQSWDGAWQWQVLKTYKLAANEDDYSRWFVGAKSPHTWGDFELGDTYAREVRHYGTLVAAEPEWIEAYDYGFARHRLPTPAQWLAVANSLAASE